MKTTINFILKGAIIAFMAFPLVFLQSCEDLTDTAPINQISEEAAFSTPELCALSVTGMYDAAQSGYYGSFTTPVTVRGYPFGAANVQQGDNRGEDVVNLQAFYRVTYENTFDATTPNNCYHFFTLYTLINRCNIIIEGVNIAATKGVITALKAAEYEGEARFLRALAHHELLVHFARPYRHTTDASHVGVIYREIPIRTVEAIEEGTQLNRHTVAQCYGKLIADLNFAETNLPTKALRTGNQKVTRVTKGAAIALKTRIYQHMWDWPNVITEATKLTTGTDYALTPTPEGPFTNNGGNSESVFSIENSDTDNAGVNGALASQYLRRALVAVSPNLWRMPWWLQNDLRRTQLYATNAVGMICNKYRDGTTYTDYNPIIRYAEVHLNLAEAYARSSTPDLTNALVQLNAVRNRAVTNVADQFVVASFADADAMITAIIQERRIEFNMEGRRWADITRLIHDTTPGISTNGIPAKVAAAQANNLAVYQPSPWAPYSGVFGITAIAYDNFRFVWPIPQDERNANPNYAQNEGW